MDERCERGKYVEDLVSKCVMSVYTYESDVECARMSNGGGIRTPCSRKFL